MASVVNDISVLLPEGIELDGSPTDNGDGSATFNFKASKELSNQPITFIYKGGFKTIPVSTKPNTLVKVETEPVIKKLVAAGDEMTFKLEFEKEVLLENIKWTSREKWEVVKPLTHESDKKKCTVVLRTPTDFSGMIDTDITFGYERSSVTKTIACKVKKFRNRLLSAEFEKSTVKVGEPLVLVLTYQNPANIQEDYPDYIAMPIDEVSRKVDGNKILITYDSAYSYTSSGSVICYQETPIEKKISGLSFSVGD